MWGLRPFSHGSRHGLKSFGPPGLRPRPALSFVIAFPLLAIRYSLLAAFNFFVNFIAFNADKSYILVRYIAVIACRADCKERII